MTRSSGGGYQVPNYDSSEDGSSVYTLHSKTMVAAIVVLCLVILFIFILHVYAKWFWGHGHASAILRRHFVEQESFQMARSVGLGKDAVNSLPTCTYNQLQSQEEVVECAVCLCEFHEDERVRSLPKCKHVFHNECIDMWLYSHSSCPLCRTGAGPDPTPSISIVPQDRSAETNYVSIFLPGNLHSSDLERITELVGATEESANSRHVIIQGAELVSLPPRESISDRLQHNLGMDYPTGVLFWGDHTHVNAHPHVTYPHLERMQGEGSSVPRIMIDLPRRRFDSPRCVSCSNTPRRGANLSSPLCLSAQEQPCTPNPHPLKSTVTRLRTSGGF